MSSVKHIARTEFSNNEHPKSKESLALVSASTKFYSAVERRDVQKQITYGLGFYSTAVSSTMNC